MIINIDMSDCEILLKSYGASDFEASVITEYIENCITYEIELQMWYKNRIIYCFEWEHELEKFLKKENIDENEVNVYIGKYGVFCEL